MASFYNLVSKGDSSISNLYDDVTPVVAQPTTSNGIVDVVKSFPWTSHVLTDYQVEKTPYAVLHEFSLETNAAVSTFLYYINLLKETGKIASGTTTGAAIGNGVSELVETAKNNTYVKGIGDTLSDSSFTNSINSGINFIKDQYSKLSSTGKMNDKYLKPYNQLYHRTQTGFRYILPYLSPGREISNAFDNSASGLLSKSAIAAWGGGFKELIESFASEATVMSPGAFIEQPQYYNFGGNQETFKIAFPLINTREPGTIQRNFDLIFLLFYQNRPFRRSVSRLVPPKIYSLKIPGMIELPFCYISSVAVEFKGNRRNQILTNPSPDGGSINCLIPDAYTVTITVKSLLETTGNMMISNNMNANNVRRDPRQILNEIRNSVGITSSAPIQTLFTPQPQYRQAEAFTEQLLVNPSISLQGIETLNRLRGLP